MLQNIRRGRSLLALVVPSMCGKEADPAERGCRNEVEFQDWKEGYLQRLVARDTFYIKRNPRFEAVMVQDKTTFRRRMMHNNIWLGNCFYSCP